jgi:hypothetical protein
MARKILDIGEQDRQRAPLAANPAALTGCHDRAHQRFWNIGAEAAQPLFHGIHRLRQRVNLDDP